MTRRFLLTICLFVFPASAPGATYFVSPEGSDSAPGTLARPFRTLRQSVSVLRPGDTLNIRAGVYEEALEDVIPGGTSWSAPVSVAAYRTEKVVLRPTVGERVLSFAAEKRAYIIISGLTLDASHVSHDAVKITYSTGEGAAHHIRIQDCEIMNAPEQGILVTTGTSGNRSDSNEFLRLNIHHNGKNDFQHGIYIESNHNLIDRCQVHDNAGWGIHVYAENGVAGAAASHNLIRNNKVHDNGAAGQRGTGIGIYTGIGNLVCNNLVWANVKGVEVDEGAAQTEVYHNTLYANKGEAGLYIGDKCRQADVRNNILYKNRGQALVDEGKQTRFAHNLVTVDPQFVDERQHDFHLRAGSPAIGRGVPLKQVSMDGDGVRRPSKACTIGAFEFRK